MLTETRKESFSGSLPLSRPDKRTSHITKFKELTRTMGIGLLNVFIMTVMFPEEGQRQNGTAS
jgi:hypothetical protein